jgi:YD repeat-containing protein
MYDNYNASSNDNTYDAQGNITKSSFREEDYRSVTSSSGGKTWQYDPYGNLLQENAWDNPSHYPEETQYSWTTYAYDLWQRLTNMEIYHDTLDESPDSWQEFSYDGWDRVSRTMFYRQDGSLDHEIATAYNERGDIITKITTDPAGNILTGSHYEYRYDGAGHNLLALVCDISGQNCSGQESRYDERGNPIWMNELSSNGKVVYKTEYQYLTTGQLWKKISRSNSAGVTEWWEYTYNYAGQKISGSNYDKNGALLEKQEWRYANGLLILQSISHPNDSPPRRVEWRYEYDPNGNISKTHYYGSSRKEWSYRYTKTTIDASYYEYYLNGLLLRSVSYSTDQEGNFLAATEYNEYGYPWHTYRRAAGCATGVAYSCAKLDCFFQ